MKKTIVVAFLALMLAACGASSQESSGARFRRAACAAGTAACAIVSRVCAGGEAPPLTPED